MLNSGGRLRTTPVTRIRVRQHAEDAHDPKQPHQAQQRRALAHARKERSRDDDEVEDVPAVAEEVLRTTAVRGDAEEQFDDEDAEENTVQQVERVAVVLDDSG